MKSKIISFFFAAVFFCCAGCTDDGSADRKNNTPTEENFFKSSVTYDDFPVCTNEERNLLVDGFSAFAVDFYHQVISEQEYQHENIFFSPYSIENAMAMTWAGAESLTADEMAHALHLTLPQETFHRTLNALNIDFNNRDESPPFSGDAFDFNLVNSIWSRIGYPFLPYYLDVIAENYDAGVHTIDFEGDPEGSRQKINLWVEDQTNSKINDLLPQGSISKDTSVVLTNAIYFKASWYYKFNEKETAPGYFSLLDGTLVEPDMMRRKMRTKYFQDDRFDAVELPYVSPRYDE